MEAGDEDAVGGGSVHGVVGGGKGVVPQLCVGVKKVKL
jgi:hypothetical protein